MKETPPELPINGVWDFSGDHNVVRLIAQWTTRSFGIICDLDLHAYCFDERARFIERLDVSTKRTQDMALVLLADQEGTGQVSNVFSEIIKIDFRMIDPSVTAVLFVLDGGTKYYNLVQFIEVIVLPLSASKSVLPGQAQTTALFTFADKARKSTEALALGVLYRDGWMEPDEDGHARPQWRLRALMDPIEVSAKRAKDERVLSIVVGQVPALEKYKPRLFGSVKDLCAALSSLALPKLKKKFMAMPGGLDITTFTEVIFRQVFETHPLITEPSECAYTVAMIQEMFQQIDYNGDGGADWDEFTTFCIQTASAQSVVVQSMDEYVIEYSEDITLRERKSSAFRPCANMKYFPDAGRFVIIPAEQDRVQILDKRFRTRSVLKSDNMIEKSKTGAKRAMEKVEENSAKVLIYDVVFLAGRDMYAFSSSDHGISVCKEQGSVGSKKVSIVLYTKIFHAHLFLKLCWSASNRVLCSVASDRTIYGWDIDKTTPIFQVSRHSDIITDFISADALDCFITCSMDRRIVMWSVHTRRVKGIMVGHKRGVRCLSLHDTTLLSAGYELDARTWDLNSKENVAVLRGHRSPIVDAKLMCEGAQSDRDFRAITVDESGEMRLWNIFVQERSSEPVGVPTLQMFGMLNPEYPMKYLKFIAIPNEPLLSTSYYSDIVACGTKMLHFVPEKNVKEFIPPSAGGFNEPSAEFVAAVGKKIIKYDVCTGLYVGALGDFPNGADLTCLSIETPRGRRLFVGCGNGDVMLVNYVSGQIIDAVSAHLKEVTCLTTKFGERNQIFTGSIDGRLVMTEETAGALHVHNTIERAFGELPGGLPVGIVNIKLGAAVGAAVVQGAGASWGVWSTKTFKRLFVFLESSAVTSFEVLGCSGDDEELAREAAREDKLSAKKDPLDKVAFLTVAVAVSVGIRIYSLDIGESHGCCTHLLQFDKPIYVTSLTMLRTPEGESVNYAVTRSGDSKRVQVALVGTTDEGKVVLWEIEGVRWDSQRWLRRKFPRGSSKKTTPAKAVASTSRPTTQESPGHPFLLGGGLADSPPDTKDYRLDTASSGSRPHTADTAAAAAAAAAAEAAPAARRLASRGVQAEPSVTSITSTSKTSLDAADFFGPPIGRRGIVTIPCHVQWAAHLDSICIAVPMHEHGCIVTGSHDGFKRVWNMDTDCMGELPLPNLTEKMKHPAKPLFATAKTWKFILEKIPITAHHRTLAEYLVRAVRIRHDEIEGGHQRHGHIDASLFAGLRIADDDDDEGGEERHWSEQEKLRRFALTAMVAPVKVPEDGPPLQLPSKAVRKLQAVAAALEAHAQQSRREAHGHGHGHEEAFLTGLEDTSVSIESTTDDGALPTLSRAQSSSPRGGTPGGKDAPASPSPRRLLGSAPASRSPTPKKPPAPKKALYYAAGEGVTDKAFMVPPAFSASSLLGGSQDKSLDDESHQLLQRFSALQAEKVEQYEASGATILLRRPEMSTSISLPDLGSMRRAEIAFGEQKDLYRNAERELNERDNLKKDKMRDAITRSRIEHNVKRMSSLMMSVITPSSHDDISIPNPQEAYMVMKEKDEKNHFRMKVRLMQSASLVSLEAKEKARPLDRAGLLRLADKVAAAERSDAEHDKRYAKREKRHGQREILEATAKEALVKKVRNAIRDEYVQRYKAEMAASGISLAALDEFFPTTPRGSPTSAVLGSAAPAPAPGSLLTPHASRASMASDGTVSPERAPPSPAQLVLSMQGRRPSVATFAPDVKGGSPPVPGTPTSAGPEAFSAAAPPGSAKRAVDSGPAAEYKGSGLFIDGALTLQQQQQQQLHGGLLTPGTAAPGTAASTAATSRGRSGTAPGTAATTSSQGGKLQLTTRMLLPFYKLDDVLNFLDIFAKVDENFSGDLDMDEWTSLFKSISTNIPAQEARSIFMKFKNDDGFLSMRELVPVVFSKASKEQQRLIVSFCNSEIVRKSDGVTQLTFNEIEQLFESYDINNFGFVAVSYIRDQIRSMTLPEACITSCLKNFANVDDDEMVNPQEFTRFFRVYLSKAELLAQKKEELERRFQV